MEKYCVNNLNNIKELLKQLSNEEFCFESKFLSGASVGQHIRHIIEFYDCLLFPKKIGEVNYDQRERKLQLEKDRTYAIQIVEKMQDALRFVPQETLQLRGNFSETMQEEQVILTSMQRELAYCLEHSIHHQALIKIALMEQHLHEILPPNFGLAPATIHYKNICVQ